MKIKIVGHTIGKLSLLLSITMILPLIIAIRDHSPDRKAFFFSIMIGVGAGLILSLLKPDGSIRRKEGFAIVCLGWIVLTAIGALPYLLSGTIPSYTDAFFETMSGLTTTGATILTNIEGTPRGILLWRALTHWLGGMGIIVLSLAVFSFLKKGAPLFQAEVPGPTPDKILPRLKETATTLWLIYTGLTITQVFALKFAGMPFFDSVIHAFATVATGGFSCRGISLEAYHSPYIEGITIIFMLISGMNFSLHYRALQKKSLTPFLHDVETKTYLGIISVSTFLIMINLFLKMDLSLTTAFRRSLFQVVSIITTTGFSSDNFNLWPPFAKGIIFTLLFVGGCTGSTGGSIKVARYVILCKYAHRRIKQAINPRQIIQTKLGGVYIPDSVIHEALAFFFIYIILFFLGSLVLMATGEDVLTSLTASATSIGNVGPGLASIGPYENYSSLSALAKWTLSFLMLTGRLELITVLVLFYPGFWRK